MGGPFVGDVLSKILVLCATRERIDQAIMSKPISTTPLWSLHKLLSSGPAKFWIPALTSFSQGLLIQKCNPFTFYPPTASGGVVFPTPLKPLLRKIPCRLVEAKIISQCYGNHNHWTRMSSHLFSKSLLWVSLQESQAEEQWFIWMTEWKLCSVKFIYLVPGSNFWDSYTKCFDFWHI